MQLTAKIDMPRMKGSRLIHHLLNDVDKHHPQAIIHSLTVAGKSSTLDRKTATNKIPNKIKEYSKFQSVMV